MCESHGPVWRNRRLLQSFRYALVGMFELLRTQRNARIHACATVLVIALGVWTGLGSAEWCWIVLAVVGVWTAEALNAAVELVADATRPEYDPLIKRAKDIAAAGVLIAAVGAAAIGLLVLGPHLWCRS